MWVAIVKSLLSLAVALTEFLTNRKLIKAGEDKVLAKLYKDANDKIQKALAARASVTDELSDNDPYRRD